ncbi:hypothetical protein DE154_002461 [Clostridium beijerinckii]|nr:hypothetical protein [Clostridium beijerinckii]NRY32398.1 hypothetical protein [Clostridium beijerinckii]NRY88216.1 hypothetical protein [Clostridium beijerinckii]NRZ57162.1 hypothetical protein [Clostridium beijerinckii]
MVIKFLEGMVILIGSLERNINYFLMKIMYFSQDGILFLEIVTIIYVLKIRSKIKSTYYITLIAMINTSLNVTAIVKML